MTGDTTDIVERLRQLLPDSWFPTTPSDRPVLDAVLEGLAPPSSHVYELIEGVREQTRLLTATGAYLDLVAGDYFGATLLRRNGQSDASFRAAVVANLFGEKATLAAHVDVLTSITGNTPTVIETAKPSNTSLYNAVSPCFNISYDTGTHAAVSNTAYHAMIKIARDGVGIPNTAGYRDLTQTNTTGVTEGRYYEIGAASPSDAGLSKYASLNSIVDLIAQSEFVQALEDVRPAGTTLWLQVV